MVALTTGFYMLLKIPLLAMAMSFLVPLPLMMTGMRYGPKYSFMGIVAVSACLALFLGPVSVFYYSGFGLASLILGLGFYYAVPLKRVIVLGGIILGIQMWGNIHLGSYMVGIDFQKESVEVSEQLNKILEQKWIAALDKRLVLKRAKYQEMLGSSGEYSSQEMDSQKAAITDLKSQTILVKALQNQVTLALSNPLPLLVFAQFIWLLLTVVIARKLVQRYVWGQIPSLDFLDWKCPAVITWVCFIPVILVESSGVINLGEAGGFFQSLKLSLELMYALFGLSILAYIMVTLKMKKRWRVAVFSMSIWFVPILVMLGILDSFLNLRSSYKVLDNKGA
jgi:hypothetical protein